MNAVCLLIAGVVRATLPTADFTLGWTHSVEKTQWEEHYRIDGDALQLADARVQGLGAGMEPPSSATFEAGWWVWHPRSHVAELRLAQSGYTRDYALCWSGACHDLGSLVGAGAETVVVVRPCRTP